MTTEYSVDVDEWDWDSWDFIGRNVMTEYFQEHPEKAEEMFGYETDENGEVEYLDELVDSYIPMMLYAYPIYTMEADYDYASFEEKVKEVCLKTNCTVVQKNSSGEYFLALTGGGMDLSQDIALAYLIIDGRIPASLALNVATQKNLSVTGADWVRVMNGVKDELEANIYNYQTKIDRINAKLEAKNE